MRRDFAGRQLREILQARRVVALEERHRHEPFGEQCVDQRYERGPVEAFEQLVAHEAASTAVHGDEDARVAEHLRALHGEGHGGHLHQIDGGQQVLRLAEHVQGAAAQAAKRVGDQIERRDGRDRPGDRVAHAGHLTDVGAQRRIRGICRIGQVEHGPQGLAQRRGGEQRAAHSLQVVHVGEPVQRRDRYLPLQHAPSAGSAGPRRWSSPGFRDTER